MKRTRRGDTSLGMETPITRRDFVNGLLVGSGAALLSGRAAALDRVPVENLSPSGSAWTGYGGVGDYRWSNGNTEAVRDAAHAIRDHLYPDARGLAVDETVDLIIVGGGVSGITAAYEFNKRRKPHQTCLLLENHPMFGGEARQNEFDVDGRRLVAPQGSNGALVVKPSDQITGRYETYAEYYRELEMPSRYELEPLAEAPRSTTCPTITSIRCCSSNVSRRGTSFPAAAGHAIPRRRILPTRRGRRTFRRTSTSSSTTAAMSSPARTDVDRWLDSISYYELLDKLHYGAEVKRYIDPVLGVGNFGVCGNAISAYAAKRLTLPGTIPSDTPNRFEGVDVVSFPGGNSVFVRRMVARMIPGAISGDGSLRSTAEGPVDFARLDQSGAPVRIRLSSTVIRIRHDGDPASAGSVIVTYIREGKLHNVRARAAVLGSGGWVNRSIVADLPAAYAQAYGQFRYGPVLTANVAVRHWRFFDSLGFTVARWFSGLGWHVCVRRNVVLDGRAPPLTPNSPIVLTFYIPLLNPEADPAAQGSVGRAQLLAASYADYERQIREQMTEMFGAAGFDARRDIAGIVLNRWGHAYFAPPIGFFFGQNGQPAPHEVIRKPHGRIIFAHSELQGNMNMAHGMLEGKRGALQALEII